LKEKYDPVTEAIVKATRRSRGLTYGISREVTESSEMKPSIVSAKRFKVARERELREQFGTELSAGVMNMLNSASMQLAASRHLFTQFAITGVPELAKLASKLATDARQSEQAAWEQAGRELSLSRAKAAAGPLPWERERGRPPTEPARLLESGDDQDEDDE
jgi:hypothetical protein